MSKKIKTDDPFKGLNLHKDLKDFYYHVSLSDKGDEFFRAFDAEFMDFVKRKTQNTLNVITARAERLKI